MGDRLPYVDLGAGVKVKALHHGFLGFCALLPADQLKCWGRVYNGRGFASPKMGDALKPIDLGGLHVKDVALGFDHACAIMSNGGLKCWGRNTYGQLGTEDVETRGDTPEDLGDNLPFIRLWD
jgi:hypothetical protein